MADALDRVASDALDRIAGSMQQPKQTAGKGKTGLRLKGVPEELPDTFMGTLTKDLASLPGLPFQAAMSQAYAVRHPVESLTEGVKTLAHIPSDILTDIRSGKWGKLSARTLELLLPGIGSDAASSLAADTVRAARSAGKVAGATAEVVGEKLTPEFIKQIRERINPKAPAPQAPEPFKPSPNVSRTMKYGGPNEPSYSAPSRNVKPRVKPSTRAAAPSTEVEDAEGKAPKPFKPNPNVARKMKFGGPAPEETGGGGSKAASRTSGKPSGSGETSKTNYLQHLKDSGPLPPAAQAEQLARYLKSTNVSPADIHAMSANDWRIAAASAGLPEPTEEVINAARGQFAWRPSKNRLTGPR